MLLGHDVCAGIETLTKTHTYTNHTHIYHMFTSWYICKYVIYVWRPEIGVGPSCSLFIEARFLTEPGFVTAVSFAS